MDNVNFVSEKFSVNFDFLSVFNFHIRCQSGRKKQITNLLHEINLPTFLVIVTYLSI